MKMTWGMRVHLRLKNLKKTQRELADCCNYNASQISRVIAGQNTPKLRQEIDHVLDQWERQAKEAERRRKRGMP